MRIHIRLIGLLLLAAACSSCSLQKMIASLSEPVIEARIHALLREDDYDMVRDSLPANIQSLESMLIDAPENSELHVYAAYAHYSYAFAFVENEDRARASHFYYRCLQHGKQALAVYGLDSEIINGATEPLQQALRQLDKQAVNALFWTALCWGKIIELNQDQLLNLLQWHKAVMLMRRVYDLDESIYMYGPNLFFGVYYGGRSPLLGGDFSLAEKYFHKARQGTGGHLLMVDLLQAQYLERQRLDRKAFRRLLKSVVDAPRTRVDNFRLMNTIARRRAAVLLEKEQEWF
jgi:hypothetical protein